MDFLSYFEIDLRLKKEDAAYLATLFVTHQQLGPLSLHADQHATQQYPRQPADGHRMLQKNT